MWCGVVWCGVVWCGVVWCGVVWCGVVWCGVVWCGVVWCGVVWCGVVWCGVAWCGVAWCGVVWCGVVWCGVVWCGVVWCGVVWCGVVWCGVVWCGVVWCGVVWCGVVWCGVVWCGVVWCGVVWCGVVWCGSNSPAPYTQHFSWYCNKEGAQHRQVWHRISIVIQHSDLGLLFEQSRLSPFFGRKRNGGLVAGWEQQRLCNDFHRLHIVVHGNVTTEDPAGTGLWSAMCRGALWRAAEGCRRSGVSGRGKSWMIAGGSCKLRVVESCHPFQRDAERCGGMLFHLGLQRGTVRQTDARASAVCVGGDGPPGMRGGNGRGYKVFPPYIYIYIYIYIYVYLTGSDV